MRIFLLPGMDGGAALLENVRTRLGPGAAALPYPPGERLSYKELETRVRGQLARESGPVTLVAESFSGPIGISIAASPPPNLKRLVLVATFDHSPAPTFLASLVLDSMFRRPPPAPFIRWKMLGAKATPADVAAVQDAIRQVESSVLADRFRSVLRVDVREAAARVQLPVLCLRGTKDVFVTRAPELQGANWTEASIDGPHLLQHQRPAECAQAVVRFMAGR